MKCWWGRHSDLGLEDKAKENFEDLTGRIPLLLNGCVARGKINLSPLQKVADKVVIFIDDVKLKTLNEGNDVRWTRYCEFVNAFFLGLRVQTVIFQTPDLVDYRFFFGREDECEDEVNGRRTYVTGGCSCGVVRKAVANTLVQYQQYFINAKFLDAMSTFYNNPSTLGFFMEYAVLYYLKKRGERRKKQREQSRKHQKRQKKKQRYRSKQPEEQRHSPGDGVGKDEGGHERELQNRLRLGDGREINQIYIFHVLVQPGC
ncbi:uncharacterized protein Z518_01212 [Rhinocladiella mackenziei CBS 650.93]|uniref:Uncharacterized protein n=1 Tax=Rhinocladiella mackenziei CBS 650.93 TaxID=1442369 RepID=A0A0D2J382_9EURO|nr:uncharacterized protein Z518_01212 [Rhinocladiella mackenziei CBS 650.93]KIX10131.1 hypothetical protein Z518_01212 [Rhinocladiella mackenziei CBS 650.93]